MRRFDLASYRVMPKRPAVSAAGADVTYTRWPRMWHDFVLQPGLVAAADSAVAQAAWFVEAVTAV